MARNQTVRRSFRSSGRKTSVWVGATNAVPTTVASATAVVEEIVSNAILTAIGFQGYIARTRGRMTVTPAGAGQDPLIAWGIGVFDAGLTTAADFPLPVSESRDPYFAWGAVYGGASTVFDAHAGNTMTIDSKGKRRYTNSDRIVLVLEGVASAHTGLVMSDFDVLVIPDQGA